MAYSDAQKVTACEIVRLNNGVIDDAIIALIRVTLDAPKLPKMTIWRWWKHYESMANVTGVTEKEAPNVTPDTFPQIADDRPLDVKLEQAAHKFVNHAMRGDLLMWSSSKDAMLAAAIAIDKMRLLRDLPTEIVRILPVITRISDKLTERGLNASDVFELMFQELDDAHGK
jgi:hypothetical protein